MIFAICHQMFSRPGKVPASFGEEATTQQMHSTSSPATSTFIMIDDQTMPKDGEDQPKGATLFVQ